MREIFQPPQAMFTPDQLGRIRPVDRRGSQSISREPPAFDFFGALLADQIRVCAAAVHPSDPSKENRP